MAAATERGAGAPQFDGRNNSVAEVLWVRLNYMAALQPWLRAARRKFLNE
jgi:hypothetical protein